MARTSRLLATAAILLACTVAGHAASGVDYPRKIEPVFSLAPPYFRDIPFWQPGGTAHVFEDFVRLTADAQVRMRATAPAACTPCAARSCRFFVQHNRGWIWNSVPAEIGSEWEVDFKFRSFGNGEKFFGDGLAFWYTERSGVPGPGARDLTGGALRVHSRCQCLTLALRHAVLGNQDKWKGARRAVALRVATPRSLPRRPGCVFRHV